MKSVATLAIAGAALVGFISTCSTFNNVKVTFYGWPDNSPPGAGAAYDCGGRNYVTGGSGAYDDPITIATVESELSVCETVYIPLLKKYDRHEDDCTQCESDWGSGQAHIDI
ncbi:hypothetical protein ACQKWADRAFT_309611 [Trichoderma austrokoningii]